MMNNDLNIKELEKLSQQALRNEAISEIIGFKRYIPAKNVEQEHHNKYNTNQMKWYYVPNIGKYNSFELKFNSDWNWLVSAVIELKKYRNTHSNDSYIKIIYDEILKIQLVDLELQRLWILVSDYCIELLKQKELEK